MVAGNPFVRNFSGPFPDAPQSDWTVWKQDPEEIASAGQQFFLMQRAIGFNCLHYSRGSPEPSLYRHVMPSKEYLDSMCIDGLRLELAFPSCGNGSTDSKNHQSHMAYPSLVQEGICPKGYPVPYPLLFFETIYDTYAFSGSPGEFVLSYGDPVGTGYHGDFMMGWESASLLQRAIDDCRAVSGRVIDCPHFRLQNEEDQQQCRVDVPRSLQKDNPVGPRCGLVGNVPIQSGPHPAVLSPAFHGTRQCTSLGGTL